MADQWRNRIIGEGEIAAGELVPHPQNWRKHPKMQANQLAGTLGGVGWVQRVIVNQRTGRMLDGHLRAELARGQGEQTPVPVLYVDLSEDEERMILATLDPIAGMAIADEATLAALVRSIDDADLRTMAGSVAQTMKIDVDGNGDTSKDTEPQIDRAEELRQKWGVEPGQLWQLGEHRLICGDCTDAAVVARVMAGEKAALCVTSPPYGVGKDYEHGGIDEWLATIKGCFSVAVSAASVWFVNISNKRTGGEGFETNNFSMMEAAFLSLGYKLIGLRIWIKDPAWAGQNPYWLQTYKPVDDFEFLGTFAHVKPKHKKRLTDEEYKQWGWRGVWELGSVRSNDVHSAMFPVELPSRAIKMLTDSADLVYEPFSGSGTTLIACENLGRRCRAVEIAPGYVAVALERWATHTGRTPELMASE